MRVLVACEFSGIVRDAFAARGHDAWSCDLLPTERSGNHIQGDVLEVLSDGWDLMIAHPPCTYFAVSGNAHFSVERFGDKAIDRMFKRHDALSFVLKLYYSSVPKVAIENPIGYLSSAFRKPDQIIQPFYFGDEARKTTCLWLKNLPALRHVASGPTLFGEAVTHVGQGESHEWVDGKTGRMKRQPKWYADAWLNHRDKSEVGRIRSKTFPGIANAMAEQWG